MLGLLPGLLLFSALPVTPAVAETNTQAQSAPPQTPKQQLGSTTELPSLVSSALTTAEGGHGKGNPKRPKNALPLENRDDSAVDAGRRGLKSAPTVPTGEEQIETVPFEAVARGQAPSTTGAEDVPQTALAEATPTATWLTVTPGTLSSGTWITSTLTPRLSAVVTDPDGRSVGIQVEVQHDPAVPAQGTGLIWSTDTGSYSSNGSTVSVEMPSGKLQDGWSVQWRLRPRASGTFGTWSAWQKMKVDRSKPSVSSLSVAPGTLSSGTWVTSSVTPKLSARVTDPDGRTVGIQVEVQHDPAVPSQGSGLIWSAGTSATTPSGGTVSADVPSGKLQDGWLVQWRVRGWAASTDSVSGPWSAWQSMRVDRSKPSVSSLSVAPGTLSSGTWVTSSLTPKLSARVTDPDGRTVGIQVEVQHDPAVPSQGSGLIWSAGTSATTPSGGTVSVDVPSDKLKNGWLVQWRVRGWAASTDSVSGPWSAWQPMRVNVMTMKWASPLDNSQVGSLTPTLAAYAEPGNSAETVSYWFEICAGSTESWTWCESPSAWGISNNWQVPAGKLKWGETYWWQVHAAVGNVTEVSPWRSFTTTPEQGSINALLASGTDGREFDQTTGNYTTTVTDASVATVGVPLSMTRTYNSLDPRSDGAFGTGWTTRWDMRVEDEPQTKTVLVTYPDGRQYRFAARNDGTYTPPHGNFAKLAKVDGGGWRLMDKSSISYWFDASGKLTKVSDRRNRVQELTYGTDGKLAKITATGGRSLTLAWTGNHVTRVSTDAVDGKALTWTYGYDGDALTKVCPPDEPTKCVTYGYTNGSRYQSVVANTKPVGYWRLSETQVSVGSKIASSAKWNVGSDDAAVNGAVADITPSTAGALAGTSNAALRFAGTPTSGFVQLPPATISGRGSSLAVEAWFKTTGSGTVVGYNNVTGGAHTPALYVGKDGQLRGQFYTSRAEPMSSTLAVNDGNWHHVVLSGNENTQTLFLDGQVVGTLNGAINHNDQNQAEIGYGWASSAWPSTVTTNGPFPFAGDIDEVAVYNKPLGLAEVRAHYAARLAQPQLTKITRPSGRDWAVNTYDADGGRLLTHTDVNGGLWKLSGLQYKDESLREGGIEATATVTDPQGETLSYTGDVDREYRLLSATDQLGKSLTYAYDTSGLVSKVTDRNGNVTELSHDDRGNTIAVKTCRATSDCQQQYFSYYVNTGDPFDPRNDQVTISRDARSRTSTDNTYATTVEYNQYGEQTKQTTPATSDFPNGRSVTVAYTDGTEPAVGGGTTPAGLVKTRTDAKGNETALRYTSAGDLAEQKAPSGLVTTFEYDAVGRLTAQTQISAAEPGGVKSTFTYDGVGRMLTQTAPGVKNEVTNVTHTAKTTYTYDADGNRLSESITDLTGGDAERKVVYTYDGHGRQETATDPEGGVVRAQWNTFGLVDTVTDELGSVFGYTYTKRGEVEKRTLKNWTGSPVNPQAAKEITLESFSYDPGGRLAAKADAMGRKTSYTYFNDNLLSQVIGDDVKLNGATTTTDVVLEANTYDAAGNLIKKVTGGNTATTTDYVYDAAGRLTSTTFDPAKLQRKTAYVYDANNLVTKQTSTGAGSTRQEIIEYAYNAAGIKTRQTVENGADDLVTTWTVDDRGLTTAMTDPRGNASGANAADFTSTSRYDAIGRLIEVKAPAVQVDKAGADAATVRPTTRSGYDTFGNQTHTVDAEGGAITTAYDKAGRPTTLTMPSYTPPGGTAVTPTIGYGYNAGGRRTTTTDPRGYVTKVDYDALGNPVRKTDPGPSGPGGVWVSEFDLAGEQLAAVDPNGARAEATYDDLGRKITSTEIERKPTTAAYTTTFTYDQAGLLTKTVEPGNKTTSYTPNRAGEVETLTDPAGNVTTTTYDLAGRVLKVTDGTKNATEIVYDLAGRQTQVKSLNAAGATLRTTGFGYDPAGNPTSQTSAENHTVQQSFDALNRLTALTEPVSASDSIVTRFGYDATGARTKLTDGRGNTTWTTYNTLGLVEQVIEPATTQHPDPADRTWTYAYDKAGNNTAILQPGGVRIDRAYDHLGRLTQEDGTGGGANTAQRTFGYDPAGQTITAGDHTLEYNDRGQLTKISQPSGQSTTMAYDANGNLTQRVDAAGTATFTWDGANRIQTATDPLTGRTWTYGYDKANRVTSLTSANPTGSQAIGYDDMGRVTSQTLKSSSGTELAKISYGWDLDDNLTTKTTTGLAGAGTNTYGYDHAGRLTSWKAPDNTTTAYEWDASGNRTKAGDKTYTYDERNRLTSGAGTDYTYTPRGTLTTETKNGTTTQLDFDAFDRLIKDGESLYSYDVFDRVTTRITGTTKQTHLYSGLGNDLAAISVSGTVQAKYSRDPFGALLGLQEGSNPAAGAFSDLHGDLVATYSGTALTGSTAYNPFGEISQQTGGKTNLGYQGEYTDPDTGKVNMHSRWYQPGTGTFTSRDTATLNPDPSVQANRYTYANASPLIGIDPTGHATNSWDSGGTPGWGDTSQGYTGDVCGALTLINICGTTGNSPGGSGSGDISVYAGGQSKAGGGYVCSSNSVCSETYTNELWWNQYILSAEYVLSQPDWDPEEAARVGVYDTGMGKGRPAPADYWTGRAEARKIQSDLYSPEWSTKEEKAIWKGLKKGPNKEGFYAWTNGWQVKPKASKNNDELFYVFRYRIGVRHGVTPAEAMNWIRHNIEKVFPFGGCKSPLVVGMRCDLTGVPGWSQLGKKAPVRVVDAEPTYWTFEALDGHIEPSGSFIRFSMTYGGNYSYDGGRGPSLWLTVTAWGPKTGVHHTSIEWFTNFYTRENWIRLQRKIQTEMPYDL
ncbi:RHS repeat-associated core domain-containing protein [Nonomuraea pusilla]|uniref:RHS repeat-associated core domain-containing protein n=1 Tax=Nonomuraea pusilla TaxID=46177 RepID=UPI0033191456